MRRMMTMLFAVFALVLLGSCDTLGLNDTPQGNATVEVPSGATLWISTPVASYPIKDAPAVVCTLATWEHSLVDDNNRHTPLKVVPGDCCGDLTYPDLRTSK